MLTRKMWRDIAQHKGQFISLFLLSFLALFIYAGVGAEWHGLANNAAAFYKATNLQDVLLYGESFDQQTADSIADLDGVQNTERRLELPATVQLEGNPSLQIYVVDQASTQPIIASPYNVEGASFDPATAGENSIWLFERFAAANQLGLGDQLTLKFGGTEQTFKIQGLVLSPEQVFFVDGGTLSPNFALKGYAYMSSNALAAALPSGAAVPYNSLLLQTDGTAGQLSFDTQLEQAGLPSNTYNIFLDQANLPSVSMFDSEIAQHRMIADIFPVVFVLVTLLVLVGTMARMITNQRTQIGTLRALGITRRAITFHYISYAFILTLCGSVLGMVAGIFALPPLFVPSMSSFYSLPVWQQSFDVSFLLMIVVIVAASVLVTWFSCRSILNEQPAQTLRPKAPKPQKAGFLHKAGILQHLGFIAQYNLRNASRNKLRSVMAIIGTLGCVALISCALSVGDAMRDMKQWQYQIIDGYQNEALLQEGLSLEAAQRLAQHYDGLLVQEQAIEVEFGTSKQLGTLTVIDTSSGLLNFTNSNLEVMELPDDGISITQHQAELLGVQVGDTIRWHLLDSSTRYESVIQSFSRHPSTQGIACLRIVAEQLGLEFSPNTLLTAVAVDGTDTGIEQIQSKAELERGWDDLTEAMNMMILLMTLAAFLLAVMVLYNLALLSFIEMERELATLKVMGLRYATLRALLLTQSIWFSVAGYILGIPCGRALLNMMLAFSGENFDYPTTWHLSSLALSLAFTLGIALLVGLLFSRRLRRIDMVTTLKAIE